jgi:hypothetical protein
LYQGIVGVLQDFSVVFLVTGGLVVPMALYAVTDLSFF